jgi:SAM-dependent methyltransferase
VAELHRVLRPGGRVGLLWNVRDESVPWMARITAVVDRVLSEIGQVVEAGPSLAGPGPVAVPYRTDLFWAERR